MPDLIRQIAKRGALDRFYLGHDDVSGLVAVDHIRTPVAGLLSRLLARLREFRAKLLRLAAPLVEERERLAGGHSLDPPRAGADRALREDHDRADLRRRTHMRAPAELA